MKNYLCLLKPLLKMNKSIIYILIAAGILFTSCVPTKDLIYLQDKNTPGQLQAINPVALKPYRLQSNDIIDVTIKAIDPKLVEMFSPTSTPINNETEQGLYYNGFTVDDH